jgi:mRNA degradation ribonuclease J1/J2
MMTFFAGPSMVDRSTRTIRLFLFSVCAVLAVVALLCAQTYVSKFNLFERVFKETTESILVQFRDGDVYVFTSLDIGGVAADPARILDNLTRREGKKISDIIQITHNHFSGRTFNETDDEFLRYFKERGFTGDFIIYHTESKKVEIKKDKGDK